MLIFFNGMAIITLVIKEAIFALALLRLPSLAAGALGVLVAAPFSYLVIHRLSMLRWRITSAKTGSDGLQANYWPGMILFFICVDFS